MKELFFKYKTIPYLFDTERFILFRLNQSRRIEINNPETLRKVRLESIEIKRENAFKLALKCEK